MPKNQTFVEQMQEKILGKKSDDPAPDAKSGDTEALLDIVYSMRKELDELRAAKNAETPAQVETYSLVKPSAIADNKPGPGKVLFYSKFHCYRIGLKHQTVGRIPMKGGEFEKVTKGESLHAQFSNNRCWIHKDYLAHLRECEGYGFDFCEALNDPGILHPHRSMETLADAEEGTPDSRSCEDWMKAIEQNGKDARIPTPLKPRQIQKEVDAMVFRREAVAV